jgi:hypothetical protein
MDPGALTATRRSLHGVAELILAGPQYRRSGTIRLRVTDGGFGTTAGPEVRVAGDRLIAGDRIVTLNGHTYAEAATSAGLETSTLDDVYGDGPGIKADESLNVDAVAAQRLCSVFAVGHAALGEIARDIEPVLWPEHFDLGISVDEVNFGVSPGDAANPAPYAYVSPWTTRQGAFWNAPFGAVLPLDGALDADAITNFFRRGKELAADA